MKSKYTKRQHNTLIILRTIDLLLLFGPLFYYVFVTLCNRNIPDAEKYILISALAVAAIMGLVNILFQKRLRSPIWVIFCGLYFAVDKLIVLVITVAICSILDEIVISPIINTTKQKYIASKVYDKRQIQ